MKRTWLHSITRTHRNVRYKFLPGIGNKDFLRMKRVLAFFIVLSVSLTAYAQGELDTQTKILLRNEQSGGLFLFSSGYGAGYRYGQHVNVSRKMIYQVDLNYIKHRKEIRSSSYYYPNKSFVYGKINNFFVLNTYYGLQHEVFSKFDKGGIAIRYFIMAGPNLGLLKPNYYEITYELGRFVVEDFDTYYEKSNHAGLIIGNSSFFRGMKEIKMIPGISFKAGVSFDYSSNEESYNAIEAGVKFDLFLDQIPIMSENLVSPQPYFFHLFVSYRFGKILDDR